MTGESAVIEEFQHRLRRAQEATACHDIDVLLVSPGSDLVYLTGYRAVALERLTALVVTPDADPRIVVPDLERAAALASPIGALGLEVVTYPETVDPHALAVRLVGSPRRVAVDDRMWAVKVMAIRSALPDAEQVVAGAVLSGLRMRKSMLEIAALAEAGAAIDQVHERIPTFLRVGMTERALAAEIAAAIIDSGHETVDFVIVGSGPNGASPHHEVSDRVIQAGEPIVIDIGGTMPSGYCSDATRVYSIGAPSESYERDYSVLLAAQQAATAAVRPGVACEDIDAAARSVMASAGLADLFIHRVGHGIGLDTHEDPYMVQGNSMPLETGMAFSIEPGFYRAGECGARLEDIVVCGSDGPIVCNNQPRTLAVVDG